MAEKVLHEVRFIETDDGFRIEFKGDKERMKEMWESGMESMNCMGPMPGMGFRHKMKGWHQARKAWKHGHGHGFMPPWMWGMCDEESEEETETPPADEA